MQINLNNEKLDDYHLSASSNKRVPFAGSHSSMSFGNGSEVIETTLPVMNEYLSIYNIYTTFKRSLILAAASIVAFLLTFCDTVYLPSLNAVKNNLNTSDILVTTSVTIYLFMSGVFSLFWGPVSDRYGRKVTIVVALIIFVAASIACAFASNIIVLIVFRAIEGAAISAAVVVGKATVADIYPVERRGWGTGVFYLPVLLGPILGPLIGGAIADAFGWQSTFIMLTIFSSIILVVVFVFVPETHQYFAKEHFHKLNPNKHIIDAIPQEKPVFEKPWKPLTFLVDIAIVPYIFIATLTFTGVFISLTVLPIHLHAAPYSYGETTIGLLFVPCGVAMLFGSLIGGRLTDEARKYYGDVKFPEGCLVPVLTISILSPIGLIIYGWTFHYRLYVAGPIIGQILLCFGYSVLIPGVSSYLTAKKQEHAAAVSAINNFLDCVISSIFVTAAVPLEKAMGTGPLFSLIGGINFIAIALVGIIIIRVRTNQVFRRQPSEYTCLQSDSTNKYCCDTTK